MFSRRERIAFPALLAGAATTANPFFLVKWARNTVGHNRFAVVVSKNVNKKSAARNKIKRQYREALKRWPDTKSDIMLIVLKQPNESNGADIAEMLDRTARTLQQQKRSC